MPRRRLARAAVLPAVVLGLLAIWTLGLPHRAGASTHEAATRAEQELHRKNLLEIQKEEIDVRAQWEIDIRNCEEDKGCRDRVTRAYRDRMRELANRRTEENARHRKRMAEIREELQTAKTRGPLRGHVEENAPGPDSGRPPGKAPLDWLPNAVDAIVNAIPDGSKRLQDALRVSEEIKWPFEDRWTKDSAGGIKEVTEFVAGEAIVRGAGAGLKAVAEMIKKGPIGRTLASRASQARRPLPTPISSLAHFNPQALRDRPELVEALRKFYGGTLGKSVRGLSDQIEGKTVKEIEELIGEKGGGWVTDAAGHVRTADGAWTRTTGTGVSADGVPYEMIFFTHRDGGVVRLKPNGMVDQRFPRLAEPHAALYVKLDPAGGTGFENEAFKVLGNEALPKYVVDMRIPDGLVEGTKAFEDWLASTGWPRASHIPIQR